MAAALEEGIVQLSRGWGRWFEGEEEGRREEGKTDEEGEKVRRAKGGC